MIQKYKENTADRCRSRGFTLVELIVVAMVVGILSAMSFALLSRMRSQAIEANALTALNVVATAYEMYYFENKSYPHWGPDEDFQSPKAIWDYLTEQEYLPRAYSRVEYDQTTGYIYGFTEDYSVDIPARNPSDSLTSGSSAYFIIFHPYNFQKDALAIGNNPPTGWVAVRARRGNEGQDYRTYGLYINHRL